MYIYIYIYRCTDTCFRQNARHIGRGSHLNGIVSRSDCELTRAATDCCLLCVFVRHLSKAGIRFAQNTGYAWDNRCGPGCSETIDMRRFDLTQSHGSGRRLIVCIAKAFRCNGALQQMKNTSTNEQQFVRLCVYACLLRKIKLFFCQILFL